MGFTSIYIFHKLVFASSLVARGLVGVMGVQGGTCLNSIIDCPSKLVHLWVLVHSAQ